MSIQTYEALFILDSTRYSRDPAGVSGQVQELIKQHGGEILVNRLWEERRLAYPIKGQRKGTYWLTYFKLESTNLKDLDRDCRRAENILRTLFLKVDARLADALVTHAMSSTPSTGGGERSERGDRDRGDRGGRFRDRAPPREVVEVPDAVSIDE